MTKTQPDLLAVSADEQRAARTLAEHLPQGYTADFVPSQGRGEGGPEADSRPRRDRAASAATSSDGRRHHEEDEEADGEISSLQLQGGDVHRSLFRMAEAPARMQKLQTAAAPGLLTPSPLSLSAAQLPDDGSAAAAAETTTTTTPTRVPSPGPLQQFAKHHHRRAVTFHDRYTSSEASSLLGGGSSDAGGGGSVAGGGGDQPMPVRDMLAPQGFRRDFILQQQQQQQQQKMQKQRAASMQRRRTQLRARRDSASFGASRMPIARNFVEFLELYGHFADEDLETDEEGEEEEGEEEGEAAGSAGGGDGDGESGDGDEGDGGDAERQPLLEAEPGGGRRGEGGKAQASTAQAFFTLLKAFVGTGIMFLPKAYNNGGLVFTTATLLAVALLSAAGFGLLLRCRQRYGGSYGDIGRAVAGPGMRRLILGSITLSQLGFVCAGIVFAAENLASFAAAVAAAHGGGDGGDGDGDNGRPPVLSTSMLIALEVAVLVPLAFVRDIARLGPAALLGDVCIALGLGYMYAFDVAALAARGWRAHPTVAVWFNPAGAALTVGAAIFSFEGIGLILPIQSSMARPARFGPLLGAVLVLVTAAYVSVGALGYATFGAATQTEVIDNYPRDRPLVQAVQCLYALAVLAGLPVQLFPAVRILESRLLGGGGGGLGGRGGRSGKRNPRVKWAKNGLRAALVAACGAVAVLGTGHLDQFVALIGSLACVPLLFVYPPFLHWRGMAPTPAARAADAALMLVGAAAMVFTTAETLRGGL